MSAFVGEKNFNIIKMHGTTIKIQCNLSLRWFDISACFHVRMTVIPPGCDATTAAAIQIEGRHYILCFNASHFTAGC
jgi:hypothetical protein